jgi:hypothetical protein
VVLPSGRRVLLYAEESPENYFEDFGSGALANGEASVALDPEFAETVDAGAGYYVFVTPKGDCEGLYVLNETATGFDVKELKGGTSDVGFDYRIVAKRKGYENVRFQDVTDEFNEIGVAGTPPSD